MIQIVCISSIFLFKIVLILQTVVSPHGGSHSVYDRCNNENMDASGSDDDDYSYHEGDDDEYSYHEGDDEGHYKDKEEEAHFQGDGNGDPSLEGEADDEEATNDN